jgi:hypothetical protein
MSLTGQITQAVPAPNTSLTYTYKHKQNNMYFSRNDATNTAIDIFSLYFIYNEVCNKKIISKLLRILFFVLAFRVTLIGTINPFIIFQRIYFFVLIKIVRIVRIYFFVLIKIVINNVNILSN